MAGVGGRTIAQAKRALSFGEVEVWQSFMRKRGPVSMQRRSDWPAALIAMLLSRLGGDKTSRMMDFMPFADKNDGEISLDSALKEWQ